MTSTRVGVGTAGPVCRGDDHGSAIVEFLALGVALLVPLLYLLVILARLQAASFAVESAARDGARTIARADSEQSAAAGLEQVVRLALTDQGFDQSAHTDVACSPSPCLRAESRIAVTVRVDVTLPGIPAGLYQVVPTRIPVTATGHAVVDRFVSRPAEP